MHPKFDAISNKQNKTITLIIPEHDHLLTELRDQGEISVLMSRKEVISLIIALINTLKE